MTRFTDSPMEGIMQQLPRSRRDRPTPVPPRGHPCRGCKRYGYGCVLPCHRGVTRQPVITGRSPAL